MLTSAPYLESLGVSRLQLERRLKRLCLLLHSENVEESIEPRSQNLEDERCLPLSERLSMDRDAVFNQARFLERSAAGRFATHSAGSEPNAIYIVQDLGPWISVLRLASESCAIVPSNQAAL
jgi:hypothetical protein